NEPEFRQRQINFPHQDLQIAIRETSQPPGHCAGAYRPGPRGAGYPFEPTGGDVAPGAPGCASTGVPFGPIGGGTDPGAPAGDMTGVPFGPIVSGVEPVAPGGLIAVLGVVGNPF